MQFLSGSDNVFRELGFPDAGAQNLLLRADGVAAEVRLYDRLFTDPQPDAGGKDFLAALNPNSLKVVTAYLEPSLAKVQPDAKFQFGCGITLLRKVSLRRNAQARCVADRKDHAPGKPVFNRVTGLRDSWGK